MSARVLGPLRGDALFARLMCNKMGNIKIQRHFLITRVFEQMHVCVHECVSVRTGLMHAIALISRRRDGCTVLLRVMQACERVNVCVCKYARACVCACAHARTGYVRVRHFLFVRKLISSRREGCTILFCKHVSVCAFVCSYTRACVCMIVYVRICESVLSVA